MTNTVPRHWETKAELAKRLRVSPRTIDEMRARGELTAYRVGGRVLVFDSAEVDATITAAAVRR
jgi:excisionase family DNA binding protein